MNIAVIGTGYVGLVTGTCFAESGNAVLCVDNNPEKLAQLHNNQVPIYEPGLEVLFERNVNEGRLKFTASLAEAVAFAEVIFLALPTPPQADGSADLRFVLDVSGQIAELMTDYRVIVTKSTVPVGTADLVRERMAAKTLVEFDVVSNPEFLREGVAVQDFMKPERVVVGTRSERARKLMESLYKPFLRSGNPLLFMDERSSELTKYAANSFLAAKISFMNEMANLCDLCGADVDMVRVGMGTDSRIGKRFLFPGVGYGGSCFPKDVQALVHTADAFGYDFRILKSVIEVNSVQKGLLAQKLIAFLGGNLAGKTVALWGLAFKPDTDDVREAPSLVVAQLLLSAGARVVAFDPVASPVVKKLHPELALEFASDKYTALRDADALFIVTEWNEFRTVDHAHMRSLMRQPVVFDGRNVLEVDEMGRHGFYYASVGRPTADGRS